MLDLLAGEQPSAGLHQFVLAHVERRFRRRKVGGGNVMCPHRIIEDTLRDGLVLDQSTGAREFANGELQIGLGALDFCIGKVPRRLRRVDDSTLLGLGADIEEGRRRRLDSRQFGKISLDGITRIGLDAQQLAGQRCI